MSEIREEWWLGDPEPGTLIWARLLVDDDGRAEVLESTGVRLRFDDEGFARSHLLDNGYRAYDGLDADDATGMGFDLADIEPPEGDSDEELVIAMTQRIWARR